MVPPPTTYDESISGQNASEWQTATVKEIEQVNRKETLKFVQVPSDFKTVKKRWMYATKRNGQRKLLRRRAHLVAKGFTQKRGVEYKKVFAPMVRYSTVRMILALAVQFGLEMFLVDVRPPSAMESSRK